MNGATATATATSATIIDPRLAVLLRAGVKHDLVEAGFESLDDAFADIEHSIYAISSSTDEMVQRWERWDRERGWDRQRRRRR